MSTRANIVLKDNKQKLTFYRHSDGYPESTLPILTKFIDMVKSGQVRDNLMQSAGWLIILGREEMKECFSEPMFNDSNDVNGIPKHYSWKASFIEPTKGIHGDIEYLYTIDLVKKTIKVKKV